MGEVWRAEDTKLGREVAIKVLPESLAADAERLARFEREAKVLAILNHPNIASIHGVEDVGSSKALVMELVEGSNLQEIQENRRLAFDESLAIARQIAAALEEARFVLEEPDPDPSPLTSPGASPPRVAAWALSFLLLAAGIVGGWLARGGTPPREELVTAFRLVEPEGILPISLTVSPDGRSLAFVVHSDDGIDRLWVRPVGSFEGRPLAGTESARQPFWSPDSKEIGFFAGDQLKRTALDGTVARTIATVPSSLGGAWLPDGRIVVGNNRGPLMQVSAAGGAAPKPLFDPGTRSAEISHVWPTYFADSGTIVYLRDGAIPEKDSHAFEWTTVDGKSSGTLVLGIKSRPIADPRGFLLYSQNHRLLTRRFDGGKRVLVGDPMLVNDSVPTGGDLHAIGVGVSDNGVLVYHTGQGQVEHAWMNARGEVEEKPFEVGSFHNPRISPDGSHLAVEIQSSSEERLIWVYDLDRGVRTLVSEKGRLSDSVAWSPDGHWLYFDTLGLRVGASSASPGRDPPSPRR